MAQGSRYKVRDRSVREPHCQIAADSGGAYPHVLLPLLPLRKLSWPTGTLLRVTRLRSQDESRTLPRTACRGVRQGGRLRHGEGEAHRRWFSAVMSAARHSSSSIASATCAGQRVVSTPPSPRTHACACAGSSAGALTFNRRVRLPGESAASVCSVALPRKHSGISSSSSSSSSSPLGPKHSSFSSMTCCAAQRTAARGVYMGEWIE